MSKPNDAEQRAIIARNLAKRERQQQAAADRAEHARRMAQALNYKPLTQGLNIAV